MAQAANRIHAKGPDVYEEYVAGESDIYPGMLLKLNSSNQVIKHTTEGGVLGDETIIAKEDALQGKNVSTVFTSGAIVPCFIATIGSVLRMLVEDDQDIAIGDKVMSAGNGLVKKSTDLESGETLAKVIGVAVEDNDLTGSDASNTISMIRIS